MSSEIIQTKYKQMLPTKLKAKPRSASEHEEQSKLILIVRNYLAPKYPCLKWLHSVPNGLALHPAIASTMLKEGQKNGIPDLCLPFKSGSYSQLYIEMKSATGVLSSHQIDFKAYAQTQGYKMVICRSAIAALESLFFYCALSFSLMADCKPYLELSYKELFELDKSGDIHL